MLPETVAHADNGANKKFREYLSKKDLITRSTELESCPHDGEGFRFKPLCLIFINTLFPNYLPGDLGIC